jgi:hypothetical protein
MDARVTELHCIMPMANIASVLQLGILSYERAAKLPHHSVALQPVQERRDQKQVPGGLKLHHYANLYFHARNPMLYKRLGEAATLCVLQVSVDIFGLPGVVITDCNAASGYARYLAPRSGSCSTSTTSMRSIGAIRATRRATTSTDRASAPRCWSLIVSSLGF